MVDLYYFYTIPMVFVHQRSTTSLGHIAEYRTPSTGLTGVTSFQSILGVTLGTSDKRKYEFMAKTGALWKPSLINKSKWDEIFFLI